MKFEQPGTQSEEKKEKLTPKERVAERRKEIKKELEGELNEPLKEAGFTKESMTWRRDLGKIVDVFNLQRSWSSHSYFVNVGIFIKDLAKETAKEEEYDKEPWFQKELDRPDESNCQIRERIEHLMPEEEQKAFLNMLDFEGVKDPEIIQQKIETIRKAAEQYAIPFFDSLKTYKDMKVYVSKKRPGRQVEDFLNKK